MGCGIATKCIYGDGKTFEGDKTGAISFPIYQTATYAHPEVGGFSGRRRRCTCLFYRNGSDYHVNGDIQTGRPYHYRCRSVWRQYPAFWPCKWEERSDFQSHWLYKGRHWGLYSGEYKGNLHRDTDQSDDECHRYPQGIWHCKEAWAFTHCGQYFPVSVFPETFWTGGRHRYSQRYEVPRWTQWHTGRLYCNQFPGDIW